MKLVSFFFMFTQFYVGQPLLGLPSVPLPSGTDICAPFKLNPPSGIDASVMQAACTMASAWFKNMQGITPVSVPQYRNILTPAQAAYWDSVVKCSSIQCLCDYWPKCKEQQSSSLLAPVLDPLTGLLTGTVNVPARYGKVTRKGISAMSDVERRRFFYAMNKLKHDKIDGWTKYDILTAYHMFVPFTPAAHFSAGVLPFHREVLKNLEVALRMEHPLAFFPYWDTSLDAEIPNPHDTVVFTNELLGGGNGNVTGGAFGLWTGQPNPAFPVPIYQGGISRAVGVGIKAFLFNKAYIDIILNKTSINNLVFCYDPFLDAVHAAIHVYIGGLMIDPTTAPGDPLFYLLHGFMDNIWEQWRQKKQDSLQRETITALPCPYNPFDLADLQLFPFPIKVKDAYSNKYTTQFYGYESPTCANSCQGSRFLVCNPAIGRCISKVRPGGSCSGLGAIDVCYNGTCQADTCVETGTVTIVIPPPSVWPEPSSDGSPVEPPDDPVVPPPPPGCPCLPYIPCSSIDCPTARP